MNCEILDTLYVKANGEIPCNDDFGERLSLGWVKDDPNWSLSQALQAEPYQKIRASLARGEAPWPGICEHCAFLRPLAPYVDHLASRKIGKIQIETSLACTLACPGCSRAEQIKSRPGRKMLDLRLFERLLSSCGAEGYEVDWVEYCGQGEPLSHPRFADFVEVGRRLLPKTKQRLITNGNYQFESALKAQVLDEIVVSCDGFFQTSYSQYRIGGNVEKALKFLKSAVSSKTAERPHVVWKYILFSHNDSDREIADAHRFAVEEGIDTLLFVVTHSEGRSQRYTNRNLSDVLRIAPSARVHSTPILARLNRTGRMAEADPWARIWRRITPRSRLNFALDEARIIGGNCLSMRGWVVSDSAAVDRVSVAVNGHELGDAYFGLSRPDLQRVFPELRDCRAGFALSANWQDTESDGVEVEFRFTLKNGGRESVRRHIDFFPDS